MPELSLDVLSARERYALEAFQRTADDVYRYWLPYRFHEFKATMFRRDAPDAAQLIPEPDFRSLAMAVRLVYLQKEDCHFDRVVRALRPHLDAELTELLDQREAEWQKVLSGRQRMAFRDDARSYSPRQVLEAWFYGKTFHRMQKHQEAVQSLRRFDPMASMSVQLLVCEMAIAIVNLDAFVRALLGQSPRDLADPPDDRDDGAGMF